MKVREYHNLCFPISHYRLTSNGLAMEIKRESLLQGDYRGDKRREITELSRRSLSRMAFTARATNVKFLSILTLTYLNIPSDGRAVKKDLNVILTLFRRNYNADYFWFIEFQERGSPHFHILLSIDVDKRAMAGLAEWWASRQGLIGEGWEKARWFTARPESWERIREEDGAIRYLTKYALKPYQKKVPENYRNVGRFWGTSRGVRPTVGNWVVTERAEIKAFLHDNRPDMTDWEVYPKYIFLG